MTPLVTVICVSYNHESFVMEALDSVKAQTYSNIEIIIVDDGSTDKSVKLIEEWISQNPQAHFLNLRNNNGYCKAFNLALREAKGEYIIDFATDDIMVPERVAEQVSFFQTLDDSYGVTFTDAEYIDKNGKLLRSHFSYLLNKKLLTRIPEGDVYADVLNAYFIPSPTTMARASVLKSLGGYDENLVYEDFDFWVRSSRKFKYAYLPKNLMKIRRNINSMSSGWYKKGDTQLYSTYLVCRKALYLNQTEQERKALVWRLKYELRQSVFSENKKEAGLFYEMLKEMNSTQLTDTLLYRLGKFNLPLSPLRKLYHRVRYASF
jgi:glycosyltransferase involved in cell wall biosynthesis